MFIHLLLHFSPSGRSSGRTRHPHIAASAWRRQNVARLARLDGMLDVYQAYMGLLILRDKLFTNITLPAVNPTNSPSIYIYIHKNINSYYIFPYINKFSSGSSRRATWALLRRSSLLPLRHLGWARTAAQFGSRISAKIERPKYIQIQGFSANSSLQISKRNRWNISTIAFSVYWSKIVTSGGFSMNLPIKFMNIHRWFPIKTRSLTL